MPDQAYFKKIGIKAEVAERLAALPSLKKQDYPGSLVQFRACVNLHEFKGGSDDSNVLSKKRGFDIRHFTSDKTGQRKGETAFEYQARIKGKLEKRAEHDPQYKGAHKNRGLKETITLWKAADRFSRSAKARPSDCELLGILLYTSGWYQYMNPLMRGYLDWENTPDEVMAFVGHAVLWASSGIEKISAVQTKRKDYPKISYRVDLSNPFTNDGRKVGEVFSDFALSSSTTELSGGYTMANKDWIGKKHCITVFVPPRGKNFQGGLDVGFRSWFGLEQSELLFRPSTPWRVLKKITVAGSLERLMNVAKNHYAAPDDVERLRESVAKVRATKDKDILGHLRTIVVVEQAV